jgi:LPXTG-motif cell wall-anchored protein
MSSIRRIVAVGLPAAGFTAALALGVSPALATEATVDQAARPVVAATGYGTPDAEAPATTDAEVPTRGQGGYGTPTATATPTTTAGGSPDTDTPTRGNPGYQSESPSPSTPASLQPSDVPITTKGSVSPAGEQPELPVTGSPMTAVMSVGGLLVAAGAASVWYTRRRRNA